MEMRATWMQIFVSWYYYLCSDLSYPSGRPLLFTSGFAGEPPLLILFHGLALDYLNVTAERASLVEILQPQLMAVLNSD